LPKETSKIKKGFFKKGFHFILHVLAFLEIYCLQFDFNLMGRKSLSFLSSHFLKHFPSLSFLDVAYTSLCHGFMFFCFWFSVFCIKTSYSALGVHLVPFCNTTLDKFGTGHQTSIIDPDIDMSIFIQG